MKNNDNPCLTCNGKPKETTEKCTSCGFREEMILADMLKEITEQKQE